MVNPMLWLFSFYKIWNRKQKERKLISNNISCKLDYNTFKLICFLLMSQLSKQIRYQSIWMSGFILLVILLTFVLRID